VNSKKDDTGCTDVACGALVG